MRRGHVTIGKGTGIYDELVFCGTKDGLPIFALTAVKPQLPYSPPSPLYTKLVCKGLSENAAINKRAAVDYISKLPGIEGHYKKQDIARFFEPNPKTARSEPEPDNR